ncbi:MAG: hypothetical protein R3F56_09565 [Planctomycetota bacterium]
MPSARPLLWAMACLSVVTLLPAQSFDDLMLVRNRKNEGEDLLQVRAGVGFGRPAGSEDKAIGLESVTAPHGHVYYRHRGFTAQRAVLLAYAGFDGVYVTAKDDPALGSDSQSRLELFGRFFPYFREGFYRNGDFVPTGRYEGRNWGAALATSRIVDKEFRIEIGGFYRRYSFARNGTTDATYTIPDDFNAYGARVILEHQTLAVDRETGRPNAGFLFAVAIEREQNDSDARFGTAGLWESELPSGLFRGRGHLEWYFPHTESSTFAIMVDGSLSDENDRVYNYEASKPVGNMWFDGQLRWRILLGRSVSITPFLAGQYVRVLRETGSGADTKAFFGGGLDARFDAGDAFSLFLNYSYLNNESRPTVSPSRDTLGEHQLFAGVEIRF